jgi:hypothetical protein
MVLFFVAVAVVAQQTATQKSDTEMRAIVNLRKVAMAESVFAMGNPNEGFACDPKVLTKLEWPGSPKHAPLVDPALLNGTDQYKFSAQCVGTSKPAGKLNVFAVPLDPNLGLRTFCATGTFRTKPFQGTSEFPIRSISGGTGESCLVAGEPLK